ncbi:DHA2 family efflux MFS transporter permease subunit [Kitasatospora sp. SUK 42]|uniref:DHA2 family efflux MFS transporter permease subunit n=1 Tax=Kitasatospora sp. SUK 42 TaxID=1588882 RepID=UPI0018C92E71|nr:DHA2 family efflux MFS transporter permease subunit [Kitasatospora sp. SUK 42]MBV2156407.1 DHA2 family efflux MFS transporter permease subunit [Kitasatospora sp. SUK 42]
MTPPAVQAPARPLLAGRAAVVVVYTAAMCMNGLDSTIVNPALYRIAEDFGRPVPAANAVETAFLVGLALGLPVAGWLGDRYGVKRVFLGALAAFTLASALCAAAPGLGPLAAARAVQGVAGGLLTPVGMTLLFRAFEPHERAGLGRILIVPTALMPALGPPLGGYLTEHLSWHWLFLVNVPIGAAAVLLGVLALRPQEEPPAGRFDTTGFLLATPGLGLLTYALGFGPSHGWSSPGVALSGLLGLVLTGAAVRHQLRTTEPLVDLRLLADRTFGTASWLALLTSAGLMGALFVLPLLYQATRGASALDAGLSVFPEAIGLMAASQVVDRLLPRLGPRRLALPALLLAAVVLASLGFAENPWAVRALMFAVGLILGTAVLTVQITGFADVPGPAMGRAMGLFTIIRTLGGALGIAATAALIGAVTDGSDPGPYRLALCLTAALVAAGSLLAVRLPVAAPAPPGD